MLPLGGTMGGMHTENLPEDQQPAPRSPVELPPAHDVPRLRELAALLDCFTDEDVQVLGKVKPSTTEAWRKRGEGPPYVLLGNRPLYPRAGVRSYLAEKLKERRREARSLL